jgi:hypothetical protein
LKRLCAVVALVLALAASASAQMINKSVIHTDARGLWITGTYTVNEGGRVKDYVYTTTKNDTLITIDPTCPTPGYLILTVPAEAALTRIALQFYEPVASNDLPVTYALGDTLYMYIGGLYRREVFNSGLWDYVKVWPVGSSGGKCDIYWRVECYGN